MATGFDLVFFENSDDTIFVEQLRNQKTGVLVTGATVEGTVFDDQAIPVEVVGVPQPIVFTEDPAITATYTGDVPDTASLVDGAEGTVVITADAGAGLHREWTLTYVVRAGVR